MRTRLDEIVEEAIAAWPELREPQKLSVIKGVALSCFRHGVERAIAATDVISGHTFDFNDKGWLNAVEMGVDAARKQMANVQPAPAEEKHVCTLLCMTARGHAPDRRKGERRNPLLPERSFIWQRPEDSGKTYGSIYRDHEADCWKWDRRSGVDRRKP